MTILESFGWVNDGDLFYNFWILAMTAFMIAIVFSIFKVYQESFQTHKDFMGNFSPKFKKTYYWIVSIWIFFFWSADGFIDLALVNYDWGPGSYIGRWIGTLAGIILGGIAFTYIFRSILLPLIKWMHKKSN